jgi:hypothetical protein
VLVKEPSVEDTISILRGLKERYEVHHGVRIKDSALVAAATLSNRYINDRFLPDKAIDLVDEAAARLRVEIDSMPTELDESRRRMLQLQIEEQALSKEEDDASKARLEKIKEELAKLKSENDKLMDQWKAEKGGIAKIRQVKKDMDNVKKEMEEAERSYDLNRLAELKYGKLPELQKQLAALEKEEHSDKRLLKEEVDEDDIAKVVSTGLFFFRRDRISMVRRISSSRPITGSSFPSRAFWVRSWPNFSRVLRFSSASPLFSYLSIRPWMALRVIPYFLHRFTTSVSPSSQRAASRWDAVTGFWPAAFSARANTRASPVLMLS